MSKKVEVNRFGQVEVMRLWEVTVLMEVIEDMPVETVQTFATQEAFQLAYDEIISKRAYCKRAELKVVSYVYDADDPLKLVYREVLGKQHLVCRGVE